VSVLVSAAFRWHTTGGTQWAHLVADTPEELHAAAAGLGMARRWFQADRRHPHYDLCGRMLRRACSLYPVGTRREVLEMARRCGEAVASGQLPVASSRLPREADL
jgi:hypothetical protein